MVNETNRPLPFCGPCVRACKGCYPVNVVDRVFPLRKTNSRTSNYMRQLHMTAKELVTEIFPGQDFLPRFMLNEVIRRLVRSETSTIKLIPPRGANNQGIAHETYPIIPGIMVLILQQYLRKKYKWVRPEARFEAAKSAADELFFNDIELEKLFGVYDPNHHSATSFLSFGVLKATELVKKKMEEQLGVTIPRRQSSNDGRISLIVASSFEQQEIYIDDRAHTEDGLTQRQAQTEIARLLNFADQKQIEFARMVIGEAGQKEKYTSSAQALYHLMVDKLPELYRTKNLPDDKTQQIVTGVHQANLASISGKTSNGTKFLTNYITPMVEQTLDAHLEARIAYQCLCGTLDLVEEAIMKLNPCPTSTKRLKWRTRVLYVLDRERFSKWEKR